MSQFGRKVTLHDGSEVVARDSPVIGIERRSLYGAYGTRDLSKLASLSNETLGQTLTYSSLLATNVSMRLQNPRKRVGRSFVDNITVISKDPAT
jgi:hypothetical protein